MSELLNQFLAEIQEGVGPRIDSYNIRLVEKMNPENRQKAIAELLVHAAERDPQAIMSLGYLQVREAIPVIREIAAGDHASVEARRTMVLLGCGDEMIPYFREDTQSESMIVRFSAVEALGELRSDEALSLLLSCLTDGDGRVRLHAYEKLISRFDLVGYQLEAGGDDEEVRSPLMQIFLLLSSDLECLYNMGAQRGSHLFEALWKGKSPVELGIVFDGGTPDFVEDLFDQLSDRQGPAPLEHIQGGTAHEREYGQAIACCWVERGDIRMPQLVMQLEVPQALAVLREVQEKSVGDAAFQQEVARVLHLLPDSLD